MSHLLLLSLYEEIVSVNLKMTVLGRVGEYTTHVAAITVASQRNLTSPLFRRQLTHEKGAATRARASKHNFAISRG